MLWYAKLMIHLLVGISSTIIRDDANIITLMRSARCWRFAEKCSGAADAGPCTNFVYRWRYDAAAHECDTFVWGGCDGGDGANRFATEADCVALCVLGGGVIGEPSKCCLNTALECVRNAAM